ncbi:MAG: adenylosuccinate synthetase [Nitrososphaerales archaeon]
MPTIVVVGGFFGDEGKGKIVSYLALKDGVAATVRGGVGPNAGHTVIHGGKQYRLRMLPSGVVNESSRLMIGPGVLVNPDVLLEEVQRHDVGSRVLVDPRCAVIEEEHISRDGRGYLKKGIGTTGTGTGPANSDRVLRVGRLLRDVEVVSGFLGDVPLEVNRLVDEGRPVLVEGTQGTFLSLYFGTYPYVTSKDVCASAICSDVGLGPKKVGEVVVVFKAYVTRVGSGPMEGELSEEETARRGWKEVGTVTGRGRRAAPFDFELAKRAVMLNGASQLAVTKLDVVFPECAGVKEYDRLSVEAKRFVEKVEEATGVSVALIGTGAEVFETVDRREESA